MKDARVLLLGANGMLGRELARACERCHLPLTVLNGSSDCDVAIRDNVWDVLCEVNPTIVINATGYTDVDGAEDDFARALHVNGVGAANLAHACRNFRAMLVQFSTDYVFNGHIQRPYCPSDPPDPINSYGLSKLAGEQAIATSGCEHLIVRTSWLYAAHGRNFVRTILDAAQQRDELKVVNDQHGRPTHCGDLAEMTLKLIAATARRGMGRPIARIVHAANSGVCTWFDLAKAIVQQAGLPCDVRPCVTEQHLRPAPRPRYSVLDLSDLVDLIGQPRHWREALAKCVSELAPQAASPAAH